MRKPLLIMVMLVLATAGCGRKGPPQPIVNEAPPAIAEITHQLTNNSLKIEMKLTGGSHGIGYQIDRAEIDPYCKCPGFWRRFYEELPTPQNFGKASMTKLINLNADVEYAFRVRAVDALGRFSEWSKIIRVRAEANPLQ